MSVEFDTICTEARIASEASVCGVGIVTSQEESKTLDDVLAEVPALIRMAARRVVEEQQKNPKGWQEEIERWQDWFRSMLRGAVPKEAQLPPAHAQAILTGIERVLSGEPLPAEPVSADSIAAHAVLDDTNRGGTGASSLAWDVLCKKALDAYSHRVTPERFKLAQAKLKQVRVQNSASHHIQDGLRQWCVQRLTEVTPRTVKGQLDCMVSALRCVLPKLTAPVMRELQGVMQPRVTDRQSMPIPEIRAALQAFKTRVAPVKVRDDYGGGASQFDAIAVEVLAVLGLRPRELIQARPIDLVTKADVFGGGGLYLRLINGKNRSSEREIPLSDGTREVLSIQRLREMLDWQEKNVRSPHGAVSSLGARFKEMTSGYTLYQMRHSWKDVAVNAGIDSELRERLMGHKVPGVAAVYGSGIPLASGLNALLSIRDTILGS